MSRWGRARGVSLLEICLVLAISADLMMVVLRYARTVRASSFIGQAQTGWSEAVAATRQWRQLHHSYANISLPALVDAGLLSSDWKINFWGGDSVIKPTENARSWALLLNKLPLAVCHRLRQVWACC